VSDRSRVSRRIGGENVLVLCFAVLTAVYFYQTLSLQRTLMSDFVGPALFPQLVSGGALILVVIYFFQQRVAKARAAARESDEAGPRADLSALLPIVPIVFYVLIFEPLGFLFSTAIYIFLAMVQFGQSVAKSLIYAVSMAIAFFVLFYYVLLTEVPMGWFVDTEQLLPFLVHIRRAIGG
jgi:putative tricarboxylic transport membrane protein